MCRRKNWRMSSKMAWENVLENVLENALEIELENVSGEYFWKIHLEKYLVNCLEKCTGKRVTIVISIQVLTRRAVMMTNKQKNLHTKQILVLLLLIVVLIDSTSIVLTVMVR